MFFQYKQLSFLVKFIVSLSNFFKFQNDIFAEASSYSNHNQKFLQFLQFVERVELPSLSLAHLN